MSAHGSHRVVTERLVLAMPETGIGLFPDVGGGWFLPRFPGEAGTYLGLTGARAQAADARWLGYATQHVPHERLESVIEALGAADWEAGPAHAVRSPEPQVARQLQAGHSWDRVPALLESQTEHRSIASLDSGPPRGGLRRPSIPRCAVMRQGV